MQSVPLWLKRRAPEFAIAVLLLVAPSAWSMDITTCGADVPPGEVGVLQADLNCGCDCSVDCPYGLILHEKSQLTLNGHSITGTCAAVGCVFATDVPGVAKSQNRCQVIGPGEIFGNGGDGVSAYAGTVTVENIDIHNNGGAGVRAWRVYAIGVTSTYNSGGIVASGMIKATNVTADNNGDGLVADGNFIDQPFTGSIRGDTVSASNNGVGIVAVRHFVFHNLVANHNGTGGGLQGKGGVFQRRLMGGRGVLVDSTLTGNGGCDYNGANCFYDLATAARPHLRNTVCGYSSGIPPITTFTWGVCTNDGAATTSTTATTTTTESTTTTTGP